MTTAADSHRKRRTDLHVGRRGDGADLRLSADRKSDLFSWVALVVAIADDLHDNSYNVGPACVLQTTATASPKAARNGLEEVGRLETVDGGESCQAQYRGCSGGLRCFNPTTEGCRARGRAADA